MFLGPRLHSGSGRGGESCRKAPPVPANSRAPAPLSLHTGEERSTAAQPGERARRRNPPQHHQPASPESRRSSLTGGNHSPSPLRALPAFPVLTLADSPPLPFPAMIFIFIPFRSIPPQVRSNSRARTRRLRRRRRRRNRQRERERRGFAWVPPLVLLLLSSACSDCWRFVSFSSPHPAANPDARPFLPRAAAPIRLAALGFGNPAVFLE